MNHNQFTTLLPFRKSPLRSPHLFPNGPAILLQQLVDLPGLVALLQLLRCDPQPEQIRKEIAATSRAGDSPPGPAAATSLPTIRDGWRWYRRGCCVCGGSGWWLCCCCWHDYDWWHGTGGFVLVIVVVAAHQVAFLALVPHFTARIHSHSNPGTSPRH